MSPGNTKDSRQGDSQSFAARALPIVALAAAMAFGVSLGVRPLTSPDIGYHLAYGDEFLDHGRITDHNDYVYTTPKPRPSEDGARPAYALGGGQAFEPAPGPGCWYDEQGRYRFANANWLTQVIFAAVNRAGGLMALCVLHSLLTAGIFALALVCMRRLGLPPLWTAIGLILIAMVAYERFILRPEMSSYIILLAQLAVLCGIKDKAPVSWRAFAAMIVLQLLMVNLHSYALYGLALTFAFAAEAALRLVWARWAEADDLPQLRRAAARLAAMLALQTAVCFVNPWTWRLVALPFQTAMFFWSNHVVQETYTAGSHPWGIIGEFWPPFHPGYAAYKATYAYALFLALAGVAMLACILCRRWAWLLVLAIFGAVSLSMRRNIAPAAMVMTPIILASFPQAATLIRRRPSPSAAGRIVTVASAVTAALAAFLVFWVVSDRFYYNDRSNARFGWYVSKADLPTAPAAWLDKNLPAGEKIWTDYPSSSNFYYFTNPHRDVPTLTNTWAYPPDTMREFLDYLQGSPSPPPDSTDPYSAFRRSFSGPIKQYGIRIVALKVLDAPGLAQAMLKDKAWRLVYLDGIYAIFLADGLAGEKGIPAIADVASPADAPKATEALRASLKDLDPVHACAMQTAGHTYEQLGWDNTAIEVLSEAVSLDPSDFRAWANLGVSHLRRGDGLARDGKPTCHDDWRKAAECFQNALDRCPKNKRAEIGLQLATCRINRGNRLAVEGKPTEARQEWRKALDDLKVALEKCDDPQLRVSIERYLAGIADILSGG
ncbi:MAG: tetratricopeptide repeat protein [Phycisphaerae bacterium]